MTIARSPRVAVLPGIRVGAAIGVALALLAAATACSTSGRELSPPGTTRAPAVGAPAVALHTVGTGGFSVSSPAFEPGGILPGGPDDQRPPELHVERVPPGTAELAVTATDPTGEVVHWLVIAIPATTSVVGGGQPLPAEARVLANSWDRAEWQAPDPPAGEDAAVVFTVFAFDESPVIAPEESAGAALEHLHREATTFATVSARVVPAEATEPAPTA